MSTGIRSWSLPVLWGGTCLVFLSACLKTRHYDEEPEFVQQLDTLRAEKLKSIPAGPPIDVSAPRVNAVPELPWWHAPATQPLRPKEIESNPVTLDDLIVSALKNSNQIRVFTDIPLIRETGLQEARGAFDTRAFVETMYDRVNEPIGNTQIGTTGGRFIEDDYVLEAGLRKKIATGGEISFSERISDKDSNAAFFQPERQSTAALTLRIVQPLLAGGGIRYNASVLHVAELDTEIAKEEFLRQAEAHLLEIARSYWALYAARAVYCQYAHQATAIEEIHKELKARADADAFRHQVLRAESALTTRRADMVRAEMAILNSQDRVHALVNDESTALGRELIPSTAMDFRSLHADLAETGRLAVANRPEVKQAFLQLRAAAVRLGMNKNEVLPRLSLILEGRFTGLDQGQVAREAAYDQWRADEMGGKVGFLFEYPLGNNAMLARYKRRQLEIRQQFNQVRTTVDTILLEVRISLREVETGWRDLQAKNEAAKASREEVEHMLARKNIEAMRAPASTFLGDLLAAQDRQSDVERALAQAAATYQVALLNLQRAQGTLLDYSSIKQVRGEKDGLPTLELEKSVPPPSMPVGQEEKK